MRVAVWDEIQDAVRGPHAISRGESEAVDTYEVRNWDGRLVKRIERQRSSGCELCGHAHDQHSVVLPFAPCLDCDCIGWTTDAPQPGRPSMDLLEHGWG